MPRLSKRKKQVGHPAVVRAEEEEEEEETESREALSVSDQTSVANASTSVAAAAGTRSQPTKGSKKKAAAVEDEVEAVWVQCDKCAKWRGLAPSTDAKALPDIWMCDMIPPLTCSDPEEPYEKEAAKKEDTDVQLRYFCRVWLKKLRCSDRAEAKLAPSTLTRGRRRQMDIEWIRCCNRNCGKWRSLLRGMDAGEVLKRLKKRRWGEKPQWFCAMNTWDETLASCAVLAVTR